jgi:outer membrane protein
MIWKSIKLISGVVILTLWASNGISSEFDIGLVDTQSVFECHPETQTAKEVLEEELLKVQNIINAKIEEIKQLKEQLETNLLLAEEEKEKQKRIINQKIVEVKEYEEKATTELKNKEKEMTKEIINDIYNAISYVAKEKGLKLILEKDTTLYAIEGLDITDEVINALQKQIKEKKLEE